MTDPMEPFSADEIAVLLRAVRLTLSLRDCRPWRFGLRPHRIELYAHSRPEVSVTDPAGRQRTLACGAATFSLRVAMANLGFEPHTALLPDASNAGHLATVTRGDRRSASAEERLLYEWIPRRRTHRYGFLRVPVDLVSFATMREAARAEGAWVARPLPAQREDVAELLVRAAATLVADATYREELARWTRGSAQEPGGLPPEPLGGAGQPIDGLLRPYLLPAAVSPEDFAHNVDVATAVVVGGRGDEPGDQLRVGQALRRLILTAWSKGLAASFFTQVIEVAPLRARLTELLGLSGPPLAVLWVGYPATGPPDPAQRRRAFSATLGR